MLVCPRCQRANPGDAVYCHFDGVRLLGGDGAAAAPVVSSRLPHPFVFASGRRCHTYDDLVAAAQEEWGTARELLQEGTFRQFLTGAGRLDLAKAAEEARRHPDPDVALDTFLGSLPTAAEPARPRLELEPRRLLLGNLASGETMEVQLRVLNLGRGLLHGTLSVVQGGDWLRLAGADGDACPLQTVRDQIVTLRVNTKGLPAPQGYGASLKIITNGGIVEVPVRLHVTAIPFPRVPYQGAVTPRDLAVRFRGNPKPAVALLESGEVARWFLQNGWAYPVNGPTAKGMAAVQQFFESMGLAKSPPVNLVETEAHFACTYPASAAGTATLQTSERKWVYGRATSDVPWLTVTTPVFGGPQRATIGFEVSSEGLVAGRHEGTLSVVGNSGQTRQLRIYLDVVRPEARGARIEPTLVPPRAPTVRPMRAVPLPDLPPAGEEIPSRPMSLLRVVLLTALAALLARLLLALPADLYARVLANPQAGLTRWELPPSGSQFAKPFVLATWWLGAVVGAFLLGKRGNHWADVPCGLIAGAMAGLVLSGTLACVLPALDWLPRQVWHSLAAASRGGPAAGAGLVVWVAVAAICWAGMGAVCGLLWAIGRRHR